MSDGWTGHTIHLILAWAVIVSLCPLYRKEVYICLIGKNISKMLTPVSLPLRLFICCICRKGAVLLFRSTLREWVRSVWPSGQPHSWTLLFYCTVYSVFPHLRPTNIWKPSISHVHSLNPILSPLPLWSWPLSVALELILLSLITLLTSWNTSFVQPKSFSSAHCGFRSFKLAPLKMIKSKISTVVLDCRRQR